ncbi:hypothetical protein HK096_009736, partial [Nowakowskiella sp. JEL0078]
MILEIEWRLKTCLPDYYGCDILKDQLKNCTKIEEYWDVLRALEDRDLKLQDPKVADQFFEDFARMIILDNFPKTDLDFNTIPITNSWGEIRRHSQNSDLRRETNLFNHMVNGNRQRRISFAQNISYEGDQNQYSNDIRRNAEDDEDNETLCSPAETPATRRSLSPARSSIHHSIPNRRNSNLSLWSQRSSVSNNSSQLRKTTSLRRLEAEMQANEALLRSELNKKFRATPVPVSSIIPRYEQIMRNKGTKSEKVRAERMKKIQSDIKPFELSHVRCKEDPNSTKSCRCSTKLAITVENVLSNIKEEREKNIAKNIANYGP